jgi:hypothetical protein
VARAHGGRVWGGDGGCRWRQLHCAAGQHQQGHAITAHVAADGAHVRSTAVTTVAGTCTGAQQELTGAAA